MKTKRKIAMIMSSGAVALGICLWTSKKENTPKNAIVSVQVDQLVDNPNFPVQLNSFRSEHKLTALPLFPVRSQVAAEGKTFLVCDVTLTNKSNTTAYFPAYDFHLKIASGRVYSQAQLNPYRFEETRPTYAETEKVRPQQSAQYTILFEVEEGVSPTQVGWYLASKCRPPDK